MFGNLSGSLRSGNDFALIQKQILQGTPTVVTFYNIPQNFSHLHLKVCGQVSTGVTDCVMTYNNVTSTYYETTITGNGATASSGAISGGAAFLLGPLRTTSNDPTSYNVEIMHYTSNKFRKPVLSISGNDAAATSRQVSLVGGSVNITSPITRIDLSVSTGTWVSGSGFWLYGIA